MERCPAAAPEGWCGTIERAIDASATVGGTTRIGFHWYPHGRADAPAEGTLVAVQGGPGFASTAASAWFRTALAGATDVRDLLVFDARGTGESDAIDCPEAQAAPLYDPAATAACADELGERAGLYGTAAAADDLAALIDALGRGPVDFYGVSYGTFFGQVFAERHPAQLRSLTFDSGSYPVGDADPWRARHSWQTALDGIEIACERDGGCPPGPVRVRIGRLLAALRAVADAGSSAIDLEALFRALLYAGYGGLVYREIDAAASSWFDGDEAPLRRLVVETGRPFVFAGYPVQMVSIGTFLAVSCTDYRMPFGEATDPAGRRAAARALVAEAIAAGSTAFAPYRIEDLPITASQGAYCADWPLPPESVLPAWRMADGAPLIATPVLLLSGELDSIAPPFAGALVAARFRNPTPIVVPGATHGTTVFASWLTPLADDPAGGCIARVIARFIATLEAGDTGCLALRPHLRVVRAFARRLADVGPATAASGAPPDADLRLAAAVVRTVADAVRHAWTPLGVPGHALRGGKLQAYRTAGGYVIALSDVRWVEDLGVTGSLRLDAVGGHVAGRLTARSADGAVAVLSVDWSEAENPVLASVSGAIDGRPIDATLIAP